jgi:hypothetical protein
LALLMAALSCGGVLKIIPQILPQIIPQILPQIKSHKNSPESRLTTVTIFTATIIASFPKTTSLILCIYITLHSSVICVENQYTHSINTLSTFKLYHIE